MVSTAARYPRDADGAGGKEKGDTSWGELCRLPHDVGGTSVRALRRIRRDVDNNKCAVMRSFSRFRVVREKKSLSRPSKDSLQGKSPDASDVTHSTEGDNDVQPD